jgi:arabinose-5-phosphate isomerase
MSIYNKKTNVGEVMLDINSFPVVLDTTILKEALEEMDNMSLGIACIIGNDNELLGVITDGDIRRKLSSLQIPLSAFFIDDAINQAVKNPITVTSDMSLIDAISLMEEERIWDLPVLDDNKLVGLLHLYPAIKALFKG